MAEIKSNGIDIINNYVKTWTKKYFYQTTYQESQTEQGHVFITEFSLPVKSKPIPKWTVKVFFFLKQDVNDVQMEFRFENDSLIHRPDRTLRISQMEKFLEKFLDKKCQTSKILFLGTEFESSRIKDQRLDKIFEEMNYKEDTKEKVYLSPNLLQYPEELAVEEKFVDEKKQIETMRNSLFSMYRAVDQADLGVVSFKECMEVFQRMGLSLNEDQWKELIISADNDKNGVIQFKEFIHTGATVIHAIFMKNQAEKQLKLKEEEYLYQAMLILSVDGIHEVKYLINEKCFKLDEEDETGTVSTTDLKKILYEIKVSLFEEWKMMQEDKKITKSEKKKLGEEKKTLALKDKNFAKLLDLNEEEPVEDKYTELLTDNEIEDIMKVINKKYPKGMFPYHQTYDYIIEHKIVSLKNGLMEGSLNKLEKYIREICQKFDIKRTGNIHINDLMRALKESNQIILSKIQIYIIQSFTERDENSMVNYILKSRILAAIIKKFFSLDLIRKKEILIDEGKVKPNQYMKGWSQEEIDVELSQLFVKLDINKDNLVNFKELKTGFQSVNFPISDEEIRIIIAEKGKTQPDHLSQQEFSQNFFSLLKVIRCQEAINNLSLI